MPVSISQAQNAFLTKKGLDNLGSKKTPNEFNLDNVTISLVRVAGGLVIAAQKNLQSQSHVSTGNLATSIEVNSPIIAGNNVQVDIQWLQYGEFLNKGVRGTKGGSGLFAFKNSFPSRAMVEEIRQWMARGGKGTSNTKKTYKSLEGKNKGIGQLGNAYAVARSIKMKGIKPTKFFDRATTTAKGIAKKELAKGLKLDIINALPKKL